MSDNKSKIKFNAEYIRSIEILITNCRTMYNKITPKIKYLHMADLIRATTTLQASRLPPSTLWPAFFACYNYIYRKHE